MTLQEKIACRDAMKEMAVESYTMFNHYQDEVKRLDIEISQQWHDHVVISVDKIKDERGIK